MAHNEEIAPVYSGTDLKAALKAARHGDSVVIVPYYEVWEPGLLAAVDPDDEEGAATSRAIEQGYVASWIVRAKGPMIARLAKLLPKRRLPAAEREHIFEYG